MRAHSASDHKAELYLTHSFPLMGCDEDMRTSISFHSQPVRKWPKWKKEERWKTSHKWFSVLPTATTFVSPGLRTGSLCHIQLAKCLSDIHPKSRSNPVNRAWNIQSVSQDSSDLLPPKLLCTSSISPVFDKNSLWKMQTLLSTWV